ncbi:hypothetical protein ABZ464_09410 [Streptomyces sp. NPDC005820]|uniref:VMAP-C domain-containing protein n=1 Tax=Streptomyces sp. NPDC005820 TaxID=3157069 RepID=UPI0033D28A63
MNGTDAVLDELTGILLRLDGFRDARTRGVLLEELSAETGERIEVTDDHPAWQARSLIRQCAWRPGTLPVLADLLRDFHGDTADTLRFEELAPRATIPSVLTGDERDVLLRMLRSREDDGWRGAYDKVAALAPERPRDLPHALEILEDLVRPSGEAPPLLRFVLTLAERSSAHDRRRLRDWYVEVADRLGIPVSRREDPAAHDPSSRPPETLTLVLRLQAFLPGRPEYLLSVWLGHGDRQWTPLVHDDTPRRVDQISARLTDFLSTAREYDRAGPSRVEFMLPRDLLNLPVDQWLVRTSADDPERPLGCLYPVVVRDLERQADPNRREAWERKWRRLRSGHVDRSSSLLLDAWDASAAEADLAPRMEQALTVLAGGTPLREQRDASLPRYLTGALECGVPVMLWHRGGDPEASWPFLRDQLAPRLADAGELTRLPHTLLTWRRRYEARDDAYRPVGHVALLWDDPEHSPVRAEKFRAPL